MSLPLHLKYRPQKLSEVVGQNILVQTLTNSLESGRIAHAYLLTGPRGCGKTSTARIIAKSLNCKEGVSINPCGKCTNCQEITKTISPDVIEIDAASHRQVSDAEQLIEKAYFPPQTGKYKVYILDEVHMLTNHAFNALLKIIEEPPPNVVFIFATTEEHKVLPTIISRCQRFSVRPIDRQMMLERLGEIIQKENINITDNALKKIAHLSKGGMRDALSLLDQVSVLAENEQAIDEDLISNLFGGVSEHFLERLFEGLVKSDTEKTLNTLNEIFEAGKDSVQVIRNLIEYSVNAAESQIKANKEQINTNEILNVVDHLFKIEYELRQSSQSEIKFKANLLTICNRSNQQLVPQQTITTASKPTIQQQASVKQSPSIDTQPSETPAARKEEHSSTSTNAPKLPTNTSDFGNMIDSIPSPPLRSLLKQAELFIIKQDNELVELGLKPEKEKGFYSRLTDPRRNQQIQEAFGKKIKITVQAVESFPVNNSTPDKPTPAPTPKADKEQTTNKEIERPAQQKEEIQDKEATKQDNTSQDNSLREETTSKDQPTLPPADLSPHDTEELRKAAEKFLDAKTIE